jgi:excisionase family DNA binding protein
MTIFREKLLTASDVASLCEVDLKTIHNWADRGRIAHFRTPGRHLRFHAADVADFLRTWGYPVPPELAHANDVLVIGSERAAAEVAAAVGDTRAVRRAEHAYDALVLAGAAPADAYVIDLADVAHDADPAAVLEALHRASPTVPFVVLVEPGAPLPALSFEVHSVSGTDVAALGAALRPEPGVRAKRRSPSDAPPHRAAAGGERH